MSIQRWQLYKFISRDPSSFVQHRSQLNRSLTSFIYQSTTVDVNIIDERKLTTQVRYFTTHLHKCFIQKYKRNVATFELAYKKWLHSPFTIPLLAGPSNKINQNKNEKPKPKEIPHRLPGIRSPRPVRAKPSEAPRRSPRLEAASRKPPSRPSESSTPKVKLKTRSPTIKRKKHTIRKRKSKREVKSKSSCIPSKKPAQPDFNTQLSTSKEEFLRTINDYPGECCAVCTKMCYAFQTRIWRIQLHTYLPSELINNEDVLRVCSRCYTHLSKESNKPPAKAYWNKLDPGQIPPVIDNLTQAEKSLLRRIQPFLKIVKLSGPYGQYSLQGQAILFAKDIFEVTEKLPTMLPRSSSNPSIIVVTETAENITTKQFTISRDAVYDALRWLICNNPLYKDVVVDEHADIDESHIIRTLTAQPDTNVRIDENVSSYRKINDHSRVLHASWNQADEMIFKAENLGKQCCAMAVANILRAAISPPTTWKKNTVDENLITGDCLYETIVTLSADAENISSTIPASGYLLMQNFDVTGKDILAFDTSFAIDYDSNPPIFGNLKDNMNQPNFGDTLIDGLRKLFETHDFGVLIAASKSYGLIHDSGRYYFTDSHSCGPKGSSAARGQACVIECDTIEEFRRIIKRTTKNNNEQYTIDYIDIVARESVLRTSASPIESNIVADLNICAGGDSDYIPLQTSVMLPVDAIQPDVEEELHVSKNINEIVRKNRDNIVNDAHELRAEEFAWFDLFPYGVNGFKQSRPVRITPLDYYQSRVLGKDTRFQRNDYLFYALSMYEFYKVRATIATCCKKLRGKEGMVEDIHLYMKNLRGTASYWRTAMNELIGQIRCLGPPTYFITFSCNDLHWTDMRRALLVADNRPNEDPEKLDVMATQRLVEKYPAVVSRHFVLRVKALMKFIRTNDTIFGGAVVDHWWRIEFQNRGSPHLHMVIWVDDHPPFDSPEGLETIDRVCCCELPDTTSPLSELVTKCQIHRHTDTCRKNTAAVCRFYFPRPVNDTTRILEHTSHEFVRCGGRICLLKRRAQDRYVNNYNPTLLELWKGNMDIQPCGSNEAIAYYVGKYISKGEPTDVAKEIVAAIQHIQKEQSDTSRKIFKICMRILKERQVSACECVFRLSHLNLKEASRECIFLNTRKPDARYRVLNFDRQGQATGFCDNIFDRYENRPTTSQSFNFVDMSLLEFVMLFKAHYPKKQPQFDETSDEEFFDIDEIPAPSVDIIVLRNKKQMKKRRKSAVVRVPYFGLSDDPEGFYYSLLLQYVPYREERELLEGYNSAREAFLAREESLRQSSVHMERFRQRDKQLETAFTQMHAFDILENFQVPAEEEDEELHLEDMMSDDDFRKAQTAMNIAQRDIFHRVTDCIHKQMFDASEERLRLFITGGAGTGKTFLLRTLRTQINKCYGKNSVKVGALTGVAARLVGGSTIHSLLALPVQKEGRITSLPLLTGQYYQIMRNQWRDVQFLFIDEISMVPYEMLAMVDGRLRQLKGNDDDCFGGIHVILFGDLFQLPPVRGYPVFEQPKHLRPATHLWRLFSLCELSDNMRQVGDNTFIDILNALRIGKLTKNHIGKLLRRVKAETEMRGEFQVGRAVRIYPTKKMVDNHNASVIDMYRQQGVEMFTIRAQDRIVDSSRNTKDVNVGDITPTDIDKTGGLPHQLVIFVNAKVMLRKNLDVLKGLVNGASGTIVEIIWPAFRRAQMYSQDLPQIKVDFGDAGIHVIGPTTVQFPAKFSFGTIERRMLPFILAWATTVHKMQGMTVDHAVVSLGPQLFAEGQAYVALSRVRSLDGLLIESLDCNKITGDRPCNKKAIAEMDRLRQKNA